MIPGAANPLLLASAAGAAGYQIERSLRFNSSDSAYLRRDFTTAGNRKTWTWSGWVKRSLISSGQQTVFGNYDGASGAATRVGFQANDVLWFQVGGSGGVYRNITSAVYRDPGAWLHLVAALDTTQATASDRVKLWVNGQLQAFATTDYPSLDYGGGHVNQGIWHAVGSEITDTTVAASSYFNGYLADIHFIDGQALDPTSFGEFDANGVWQPKAYTGSYGTNGFHLDFADNSAATTAGIGKDVSGNGNDWTPVNLSVAAGAGNDSLVDTPTNYGTDTGAGGEVRGNYATLNPLDGSPSGLSNGNLDAASANAYPTIIPGSGQWYYEVNGTGYQWDGIRANWTPRAGSHNFGQRAWASSPPTGFKALCTTNLPEPLVVQPSEVMDVKLYTGNGSTQTISGLGFSPDLVWGKERSGASSHVWMDVIRGAGVYLRSDLTNAESANANVITSFDSSGFTLGTSSALNGSGNSYVAWAWDAGSSTVTNTDGSITSQVRANPSAGFSIVTYTGNGTSGATIGHGLGVAPQFVIIKNRTTANSWQVGHTSIGWLKTLYLNSTAAQSIDSANFWNNTAPSSSVVTLGTTGANNTVSDSFVAYCFAPVASYSAFGSYVGNGSANGPFVYTGMLPRWIMVKRTDTTGNWTVVDTAREGYNVDNDPFYANTADSEAAVDLVDIISNGFKLRTTDASVNASAGTYVYACFAGAPFQASRAR